MSRARTPTIPTPTTPLRRVSRNSLHLASKQLPAGATPLSFLERALGENLAEELNALKGNLENIEHVHESLHSFNENFAMYIYGLKMNAYCVEWPEAPLHDNFERAEKRIAQQAQQYAAQHNLDMAISSQATQQAYLSANVNSNVAADQTYVTTDDESIYRPEPPKPALQSALKKPAAPAALTAASKKPAAAVPAAKGAKPKMTAAQKKARETYTDGIIQTLPLEYRGNDPKQNSIAKHVCMALIAAGSNGLRIAEIVNAEMTQAKINKTLIALVAAKHVVKKSNNVSVDKTDKLKLPCS